MPNPYPPTHPIAPHGRPKGALNKRKPLTSNDLVEKLGMLNFDVVKEVVSLYRDNDTRPAVKYKCAELPNETDLPGTEIKFRIRHD
jgi:hypothetical protein